MSQVPYPTDVRPGMILPLQPAAEITEAQIVAFFRSKAIQLYIATGKTYAYVQLAVYNPGSLATTPELEVAFTSYVDGGKHEQGATLAEAMDKNTRKFKPVDPAELRKHGLALIDAAAAAERNAAPHSRATESTKGY